MPGSHSTPQPRRFDADDPTPLLEVLAGLDAGARIFISGTMNEPRTIDGILARHTGTLEGCRLVDTRLPGFRNQTYPDTECEITCFFLPLELRGDRRTRFVPQHYRETHAWLSRQSFDLALIELAPTADPTLYSHGLTYDFAGAVLPNCDIVVAEINHALPAPPGAPSIKRSDIDLELHSTVEPRYAKESSVSPELEALARNVANLIEDGDCLQTGLGALPDTILHSLQGHKHLGCHSGMLGDGMMTLYECGALDGSRKTIDPQTLVTGFLFGSEQLYRWAASNPALELRGVDYTHDIEVLGSIDSFVSINSAVEVDLLGQVNSEIMRARQISGTGGAVDFMRGARRSKGGRSIVALPATAASGRISRICSTLPPGTPVTAARTDTDYVVTEFGVAHLSNRSLEERAQALISVSHPDFRPQLEKQAESLLSQLLGFE